MSADPPEPPEFGATHRRPVLRWVTAESARPQTPHGLMSGDITGPAALENTDFTARLDLGGPKAGQTDFYRVVFQCLADPSALSAPLPGRFRTPATEPRDVVFAFSGDEAGQGWGINEAFGGYRVYEAMRRFEPDFFIHSGDQIYADGPIAPEVTLDDGTL